MPLSNHRAWLRMQIVAGQVQQSRLSHALCGDATVCITGAAGFVGSWLVTLCLKRGYRVRACVRSADDDKKVGFLKAMSAYKEGKLTLHSADMTVPGSYDEVFEGCSTVFHPAEVYMTFASGRDIAQAKENLGKRGKKHTLANMHDAAMAAIHNIVDSINKSSTVTRLIYTSSIASLIGDITGSHIAPICDESGGPLGDPTMYGPTKRLIEKFLDYAAYASGGKWSTITGNPADIIGPILAPHHAGETWSGKMSGIIQGITVKQEQVGRPWCLCDVRDVAEAQIRLAESPTVRSGERYFITSGDLIYPERIGTHVMELYPEWDCATTLAPMDGAKELVRTLPMFQRYQLRNDKIRKELGIEFHSLDDTLKATVDSLTSVGGVEPRLKK